MAIGAQTRGPAQHCQQVTDRQAYDHVPDTGAPGHEQRADDELGRGDVLAGIGPSKVRPAAELVFADGLTVEFVKPIETLNDAALMMCLLHGSRHFECSTICSLVHHRRSAGAVPVWTTALSQERLVQAAVDRQNLAGRAAGPLA